MSENEKNKNRIIEITTELLKEHKGDTRKNYLPLNCREG